MPAITEARLRRHAATKGLRLSRVRGTDRYRVVDPNRSRILPGGMIGVHLPTAAEIIDAR
jgi:hypothetical protein